MDIACPPCITKAMHRVADNRIYGYTFPTEEYYKAIIDWFQRRHNWNIKKDEVLFSPGTVNAVGVAVKAFTDVGDGVIIQRPVYYPFTPIIEENNRIVANNQMIVNEEGYYVVDLENFEALAKKPENKLFILCNPHNPSGRIFSNDDLKAMAKICKDNDVKIIADEIHGDLIRKDSVFTPIVKVAENTDHIITCTAINKTFNVAGLHATNVVISNPELRETYKKELGMSLPTPFTVAAVIAAYTEGEQWLEELKEYFDETIDWVMNFCKVNLPKLKFVRPEGTYIFWMDFRDYGLSHEEIHKKIYVDANVLLEGGLIFDPDKGAGFERICLSSPRALIQEAFERIAEQFKGL
jgi:cystathionine beta-lyase